MTIKEYGWVRHNLGKLSQLFKRHTAQFHLYEVQEQAKLSNGAESRYKGLDGGTMVKCFTL